MKALHHFPSRSVLVILWIATISFFWIRSYYWEEGIHHITPNHEHFVLRVTHGQILLEALDETPFPARLRQPTNVYSTPSILYDDGLSNNQLDAVHYFNSARFAGFTIAKGFRVDLFVSAIPGNAWAFGIPFWFVLALPLLALLKPLVRTLRHRRRRKQGLCPICSYDLRASPNRCPECGTPAKPPSRIPKNLPSPT